MVVMDYKEFVEKVAENLKAVMPDSMQDIVVTTRQVEKLQGESYYGISVQPKQSNIGVSLDLNGVFEKVEEGMSFGVALQSIGVKVSEALSNHPDIHLSELMNYEAMKEKLMVQVVPTAGNETMLTGTPHVNHEDMSMIYRFVMDSNEHGIASILVTNEMLENYGISAEKLHADAMKNAPEHFPFSVRSMQEVLAEMMGIEPDMMPMEEIPMYVATCNQGVNGAGCIFYPEFMEQASERLSGDFFILPSSVHEVLLLPERGDMSFRELEEMVQSVNEEEVAPKDRLSGTVYHYDSQDKVFEKAETYEKRMQAKQAERDKPRAKESLMKRLGEKKKEAAEMAVNKNTPHKAVAAEL